MGSYRNDQTTPTLIPIQSSTHSPTPIPIHHPNTTSTSAAAATKIQSHYRSHLIRRLTRQLLSASSQADLHQRMIQTQETVDSVRSDERERLRLSESLMGLLLELDSVPGGFDPNVREARRRISRRIVELTETLDGIVGEKVEDDATVAGSLEEFCEKIWVGLEGEDNNGGGEGKTRRRWKCCLDSLEEFVMGM